MATVRWSNGAAADDTTPDVHGMAVKVLAVKGTRSLEGVGPEEQDFVLIDSEVFFAPDVKTMLDFMKARVASATKPAVLEEFTKWHLSTVALLEAAKTKIPSPVLRQYLIAGPAG